MRSMRPGTCGDVESRSATTFGGTSNPTAQAATPSAFATLNRPSSGRVTGWLPFVVTSVKRAPFASTRTSRAVTSAFGPVAEKVIRRGERGSRAHAASSALMTARPASARYPTSLAFAAKYASNVS